MSRLGAKAIPWGIASAIGIATSNGTGCSATKPTELVPGVLTQVQVPRDLDGVEVEVQVNHTRTYCTSQAVRNGRVDLPRTLGIVAGSSEQAIVTVIVRGFSDSQTNGASTFGCTTNPLAAGAPNGPAVVRSSTQTYVDQHELYVPIPLSFSCFGADCTAEEQANPGHQLTCKGGQCVDIAVDLPGAQAVASKLVDFNQSLVDGTDVCFSPSDCFADEVPAFPVDADACIFGFPPIPGIPVSTGLNVRVGYKEFIWEGDSTSGFTQVVNEGEHEILDVDPTEGFCVGTCASAGPDAGADASTSGGVDAGAVGRTFQLAPGLCKLVKQAGLPQPNPTTSSTFMTINEVHVASLCAPKVQLLPICATQRAADTVGPDGAPLADAATSATTIPCDVAVPLVQTPSAIYPIMDNSAVMHGAFGPQGSAQVLSLSLSDPVFRRTSAAFDFLTHDDTECPPPLGSKGTTLYTSPSIPFGPANVVQVQIAQAIAGWVAPDTTAAPARLDLLAAMRDVGAYGAVNKLFADSEAPNVAGAMFFVNRTPDPTPTTGNECSPASGTVQKAIEEAALAAYGGVPSLQTFFVVLSNDASDPAPLAFYQKLQTDLPLAITTLDATSSNASTVLANFAKVITTLGTCLYEVPAGVRAQSQLLVQYVDSAGTTVSVPKDTGCNPMNQSTANGWNLTADAANITKLRICGAACDNLRSAINTAAANAIAAGQPPPDVPVTGTLLCSGTVPDAGSVGPLDAGTDAGADATVVGDGASASD